MLVYTAGYWQILDSEALSAGLKYSTADKIGPGWNSVACCQQKNCHG